MVIALGLYVTSNDKLEISILFTSFQLVNSMTFPIMALPNFINQIFKDLISIERIQNYLFTQDHQDKNIYKNIEEYKNNNLLVKFDNTTFSINEINLDIQAKITKSKSSDNLNIELQDLDSKLLIDKGNSNNNNENYKNNKENLQKVNKRISFDNTMN